MEGFTELELTILRETTEKAAKEIVWKINSSLREFSIKDERFMEEMRDQICKHFGIYQED